MSDSALNTPAAAAVKAIQKGDVSALRQVLEQHPELVSARVDRERTLLHVATDWPGHFPNNVSIVKELIAQGASVNAPFTGKHSETPLHWAASTNDVDVLDVLLDYGADTESAGGVIAGGTPLADAVAFGQWDAARRLVDRGAVANLWQSAALGLMDRVEEIFASAPPPSGDEINQAFWCACHGGQQDAAEYLLQRGADVNWPGYDALTPLDAAARRGADPLVTWLRDRGATSAKS